MEDDMKKTLLLSAVLAAMMFWPSVGISAQDATIAKALAPLPARSQEGATVVSWNDDYTYEVLKEGSGQLVCYDRASEDRRGAFDVQCTNLGNLDRVAQNRRFRAESSSREEEGEMIAAAEAASTREEAVFGSLWIAMRGEAQGSAGIHTTIAMPYATEASTGFAENGRGGGSFIMAAGTSAAHLMVPGR
jgi:hypothetical protein|tara:strand:+ start:10206 stop:10775 length:570 start_codon:yes stop_codon:yes gene_type:complete